MLPPRANGPALEVARDTFAADTCFSAVICARLAPARRAATYHRRVGLESVEDVAQ